MSRRRAGPGQIRMFVVWTDLHATILDAAVELVACQHRQTATIQAGDLPGYRAATTDLADAYDRLIDSVPEPAWKP